LEHQGFAAVAGVSPAGFVVGSLAAAAPDGGTIGVK